MTGISEDLFCSVKISHMKYPLFDRPSLHYIPVHIVVDYIITIQERKLCAKGVGSGCRPSLAVSGTREFLNINLHKTPFESRA